MNILVTNDDGMHSRGLWALAEALGEAGRVTIIAPDREQSGVGTSISIRRPLRLNRLPRRGTDRAYSLEGTPADCVLVAIGGLLDSVDLVVSGINEGANVGDNILVSGTVGAALQGYFHGIPSMAVSVSELRNPEVQPAARTALHLAKALAAGRFGKDTTLLNVNLPNKPRDQLKGVVFTEMAHRAFILTTTRETDIKGNDVCRVGGELRKGDLKEGTDAWAIREGYVSISPIDHSFHFRGDRSRLDGLADELFAALGSG